MGPNKRKCEAQNIKGNDVIWYLTLKAKISVSPHTVGSAIFPLLLPGSWSKEILWPVSFLLQRAESMVEANSSNQSPTARIHSHRGTSCSPLGFNSPKWQIVENTGTLSSSASFKRYMKVYIFSDRKALHVNLVELWEAMEIKFYAIEVFLKAPWKWWGSRTFSQRLICKM